MFQFELNTLSCKTVVLNMRVVLKTLVFREATSRVRQKIQYTNFVKKKANRVSSVSYIL